MLNQLEALRCFCIAAETLHFSETAIRLSVSPQVVSRLIAELEAHFGEQLFKRNTRKIALTAFGEALLPKARRLLADSEELFSGSRVHEGEMTGLVRIALPPLHNRDEILFELLQSMADYPDLKLDWRVDSEQYNWVKEQIDMGIRVGSEPDSRLIVKPICLLFSMTVASPALLAKWGQPSDMDELMQRFPISALANPATGRLWDRHGSAALPKQPDFVSNDIYAEMQSALAGRTISQLPDYLIAPYLQDGRLVQLFPDMPMPEWQMYLYRPYQNLTSARVKFVFDELGRIVQKYYGEWS